MIPFYLDRVLSVSCYKSSVIKTYTLFTILEFGGCSISECKFKGHPERTRTDPSSIPHVPVRMRCTTDGVTDMSTECKL